MSEADRVHKAAMREAWIAEWAEINGLHDVSRATAATACDLEVKAAELVAPSAANEPWRSVLYRSAACLALWAGQADRAEELADEGLRGWPPDDIADELREAKAKAIEMRIRQKKEEATNG